MVKKNVEKRNSVKINNDTLNELLKLIEQDYLDHPEIFALASYDIIELGGRVLSWYEWPLKVTMQSDLHKPTDDIEDIEESPITEVRNDTDAVDEAIAQEVNEREDDVSLEDTLHDYLPGEQSIIIQNSDVQIYCQKLHYDDAPDNYEYDIQSIDKSAQEQQYVKGAVFVLVGSPIKISAGMESIYTIPMSYYHLEVFQRVVYFPTEDKNVYYPVPFTYLCGKGHSLRKFMSDMGHYVQDHEDHMESDTYESWPFQNNAYL